MVLHVCAHDEVAADANDSPPEVNCSESPWKCSHCHREDQTGLVHKHSLLKSVNGES